MRRRNRLAASLGRLTLSLFLPINSVLQSNWRQQKEAAMSVLLLPERDNIWGPVARRRLGAALAAYGAVLAFASALIFTASAPGLRAFSLGLTAPGAGFLFWAAPGGDSFGPHLAMAAGAAAAFGLALFLWFATGAVVAPVAAWLGAALLAAFCGDGAFSNETAQAAPIVILTLLDAALIVAIVSGQRALTRRKVANAYLAKATPIVTFEPMPIAHAELSLDDVSLLRLLLDRALQPIDKFEGFEWIDQYQTAAIRYQLNFMSYALSIAQAERLPAFRAYLTEAQRALVLKQLDPRVWRYWRYENLLGHLRPGGDPIPRGNIMFTGFLAMQIALYEASSGEASFDAPASLRFVEQGGAAHAYRYEDLIGILATGFQNSPFGLLPCEPNWIYPLCNMISACAIRAFDARRGERNWDAVAPVFRAGLENDFIAPDGALTPFLSSLTGASAPITGGVVMQTFPCLYLDALFPDIAERQWLLARRAFSQGDIRRPHWPIDTGNYRFSRAAGYAASAAAAVELGDRDMAARFLSALDEDCPRVLRDGVAHRPRASLWAHAVEMFARCATSGSLRRLVAHPAKRSGPFISAAAYPDVLPAKATANDGALYAVLYPGAGAGLRTLTLGGLKPGGAYVARAHETQNIEADDIGEAPIRLLVDGRTELLVHPAA